MYLRYKFLLCITLLALPCAAAGKKASVKPNGLPAPISAVSVTPNSGSGLSQTFTAIYGDVNGAADIQVVYLDFSIAGVGEPNSCLVAYVPATNSLYLFSDGVDSISPPITPGSATTASNSQCTLSGSGGPVTATGNNLTVPFAITFASSFTGKKKIYGEAENYAGGRGGAQLGTWTPSEPTLTAVSVTPVNGSGSGPTTFTAVYSDSLGASDIQVVYLLFVSSPSSLANSCVVAYMPAGNQLYLFNDAGNGAVAGSPITAGTSSALSNTQCTLSGSGGVGTPSGSTFSAPFSISFQTTQTTNVYGLLESNDGTLSAAVLFGTWGMSAQP